MKLYIKNKDITLEAEEGQLLLNVLRDRRLCHQQKLRRLPVIHCVIQREKGLDAMINHDDTLLIRDDYYFI